MPPAPHDFRNGTKEICRHASAPVELAVREVGLCSRCIKLNRPLDVETIVTLSDGYRDYPAKFRHRHSAVVRKMANNNDLLVAFTTEDAHRAVAREVFRHWKRQYDEAKHYMDLREEAMTKDKAAAMNPRIKPSTAEERFNARGPAEAYMELPRQPQRMCLVPPVDDRVEIPVTLAAQHTLYQVGRDVRIDPIALATWNHFAHQANARRDPRNARRAARRGAAPMAPMAGIAMTAPAVATAPSLPNVPAFAPVPGSNALPPFASLPDFNTLPAFASLQNFVTAPTLQNAPNFSITPTFHNAATAPTAPVFPGASTFPKAPTASNVPLSANAPTFTPAQTTLPAPKFTAGQTAPTASSASFVPTATRPQGVPATPTSYPIPVDSTSSVRNVTVLPARTALPALRTNYPGAIHVAGGLLVPQRAQDVVAVPRAPSNLHEPTPSAAMVVALPARPVLPVPSPNCAGPTHNLGGFAIPQRPQGAPAVPTAGPVLHGPTPSAATVAALPARPFLPAPGPNLAGNSHSAGGHAMPPRTPMPQRSPSRPRDLVDLATEDTTAVPFALKLVSFDQLLMQRAAALKRLQDRNNSHTFIQVRSTARFRPHERHDYWMPKSSLSQDEEAFLETVLDDVSEPVTAPSAPPTARPASSPEIIIIDTPPTASTETFVTAPDTARSPSVTTATTHTYDGRIVMTKKEQVKTDDVEEVEDMMIVDGID